ncbi:glycosyltransferase family 4 protein [Cycloclasticus pugetii]|uniref:glycosyltransferase family 4 protein n=1 Tax=Cycloclasticus pugetii TaxID=34068 RepID=UPI00037D7045|nr:glycosyltransferase family 4 protein [Cycloclasticus pugetii]
MSHINKKNCVIVTCFDQNQPGFLDFSYRIKTLAEHYNLTLVSTFPLTQAELQFSNVNYVVINARNGRLGWLSYLLRCASLIRKNKPALSVLLHSMAAPVAMFIGRIPAITYWNEHPSRVIPQEKGVSFLKTRSRAFVKWLIFQGARRSSLVMPIGEAHRDDLLVHGCKIENMKMIYMGVQQSFSEVALKGTDRTKDAPLRMLYVGSVQKDRGRDLMLDAMAIVNQEKYIAHLTIVGANEEQLKYCVDKVKELGLEASVTLIGRVPGNLIPSYMEKVDAGLCLWEDLPWYSFNPPTKLFEYLVAGLPVLASNIRTHTQYIEDGKNGLIFEYESTALAQAVQRLWDERNELQNMKQYAFESSTPYLWQSIEPCFIDAIQEHEKC